MKTLLILLLSMLFACQGKSTLDTSTIGDGRKGSDVNAGKEGAPFDLGQSLSQSPIIGSKQNEILSTDTISENLYLTTYSSALHFMGYVVWEKDGNIFNPLWQLKDSSDFPPHTFSFVDFDNDGRKDLTMLYGQEDVYASEVYFNRVSDSNSYSKENFRLAYQNMNDYVVVVDINGDGIPELLDSGYDGDEHEEREALSPSKDIKGAIAKKYDEITRVKGANNFDFNMPDYYREFNSFLLDKIKIIGFKDGKMADITCQFKPYLDWRINLLMEMKKNGTVSPELASSLISYHQKIKICN